mmetsp:Transcript_27635/g.58501  ORF Transcript_27635/g.58501 Transcript_27635/m.58501 type:complete len:229 (+) Transcript_27635:213-899(+)
MMKRMSTTSAKRLLATGGARGCAVRYSRVVVTPTRLARNRTTTLAAAERTDEFSEVFGAEPEETSFFSAQSVEKTTPVTFELPLSVAFGDEVCVVGDAQGLGSWSLSKAKKLEWHDGDVWSAQVDLPSGADIQYKYAITSHNQEDAKWMPGPNFSVSVPDSALDVKDAWGQAKKEQGMPGNGNGAADLSQADALSKMTVKEIKTLLKDKGLPVSGKKADLIGRLIPHL